LGLSPRDPFTSEIRRLLEADPRLAQSMAVALIRNFQAGRATAVREVLERLEGRVPYVLQATVDGELESQLALQVIVIDSGQMPPLYPAREEAPAAGVEVAVPQAKVPEGEATPHIEPPALPEPTKEPPPGSQSRTALGVHGWAPGRKTGRW
jgi:hypothetical protein